MQVSPIGAISSGALLLASSTAPLPAQTISIQSVSGFAPDLGQLASAARGDTVFTIDPVTGAVTRVGGTGSRLTNGVVRATVTLRCAGGNGPCARTPVRVRVGSVGTPSGRATALRNFTVASGTAVVLNVQSTGDPIEFTLQPIGRNIDRTFHLGFDFTMRGDDSGAPAGRASAAFNVRVAADPHLPAAPGTTGQAVATVFRSISIARQNGLEFGAIVRPSVGTSTIAVDPATAERTIAGGNAVGLSTPPPMPARYRITGQDGRMISIDVPTHFTMTRAGGSHALTVATSRNFGPTVVLSGGTEDGARADVAIGGAFDVASTTPPGAYAGHFTVSVQYN